jgi:YidC/Oxa1 family membrane protein insertase
MSFFPGVPVDAAYHVVSGLATLLAPLAGGLATAAAIVGFTVAIRLLLLPLSYRAMRGMAAQARIAPQVQALQKKHAGHPDRLQRDLAALYRSEGTSMFAGCLPALAQWPVLSVVYLLFRSPQIAGAPNTLLSHGLFGAPLGSYWLGGAGPLSAQGAVFAGLFLLLAGIGWLSARLARRIGAPATPAAVPGTPAAGPGTPAAVPGISAAGPGTPATGPGTPATWPARTPVTGPAEVAPRGAAASVFAALARVLPYFTVAVAAFVPLAAGVYLLATTAWTLAERALVQRALAARPAPPAGEPPRPPAAGGAGNGTSAPRGVPHR